MSNLGAIGQVPNYTVFQGAVKAAIAQGRTTSTWNRLSGGSSRTHFQGTQAQVTILAQEAQAAGYEYSIEGGATWSIDVTFPWDIITNQFELQSNPLYVWELVNQPFERDIYELNERSFIGNLSTLTKDNIQLNLTANNRSSNAWDPVDGDSWDKMVGAKVLYNLKRIGVRGKPAPVQTLKRTLIVPQTYTLAQDHIYSGYDYKLFTTPQLVTKYSDSMDNPLNRIPTIMRIAMPTYLSLQVWVDSNNVVNRSQSGLSMDKNGIVTFVGWLQFPVEYHMIANNKIQITQAWTFNQWSAGPWGLYDMAYPEAEPYLDPKLPLFGNV